MSVHKYQKIKTVSSAGRNNRLLIILLLLCVSSAGVMICINKFKQLDVLISHPAAVEKIPDMIPGVCTIQGLRIRREPSLETDILGLLDRNEHVNVFAVSKNKLTVDGMTGPWLEVEFSGGKLTGWVFSGYITTDNEQLALLLKKKRQVTSAELQKSEMTEQNLASADQPIEDAEIIPDPFTIVVLENSD